MWIEPENAAAVADHDVEMELCESFFLFILATVQFNSFKNHVVDTLLNVMAR